MHFGPTRHFGHYSQFSLCGPSLYCLQTIVGQLTLFPYSSSILAQLDILATTPSLADVSRVFTVCRPSWVNSPYFRIILAFWSNLTFWPLFSALANAAQIFTVCRPSWVNSPYFHIILEFWFNSTFWPIFPDLFGAALVAFYSVTGKLISYNLVKSRILRNSTFWPMSRFRIWGCQRCFPQEIMYFWRMSVVSHTSRFAYKSIRIHRGRFVGTILVDSHTSKSFRIKFESTTLKSIRIHNLSRNPHFFFSI